MKHIITGIFIILSQHSWSQQREIIIIESFAVDSFTINQLHFLKMIDIKGKGWFKSDVTYDKLLEAALDSTLLNNANLIKVVDTDMDNHIITVELYDVDVMTYSQINRKLCQIQKEHLKRFNELSWIGRTSVKKHEDYWYKENRFKHLNSIPRDSTTGKYIEIGISAGSDVLLVGLNLHTNIEFYLLNTSYAKISLSNKAGLMLVPIGEYYITYTSPGIKFSVPIKNIWLTASFGKEYIRYHVNDENYSGIKTDVIDKRIDFGLKFYKTKNTSIEVYYPLRLDDDVIPWWTGGIIFSMNYRI